MAADCGPDGAGHDGLWHPAACDQDRTAFHAHRCRASRRALRSGRLVPSGDSCGDSLGRGVSERPRRTTPLRPLIETQGCPRFGSTLIARVVPFVFTTGQGNTDMVPEPLRGAQMGRTPYANTKLAQAITASLRDKDATNQNSTGTLLDVDRDLLGHDRRGLVQFVIEVAEGELQCVWPWAQLQHHFRLAAAEMHVLLVVRDGELLLLIA